MFFFSHFKRRIQVANENVQAGRVKNKANRTSDLMISSILT